MLITWILPALVAIVVMALGAPAWAANCGDHLSPRVACACGDAVVTNTTLQANDPVVAGACAGLGLSIGADNITLNCNGRRMSGDFTDDGIRLGGRTGVIVRGCKLAAFFTGIRLLTSSGNRLLSNTISNAGLGIVLELDSQNNHIASNHVVAPGDDAINLGAGATGNTIASNTLEGAGVSGQDGIDIDGPDATGNTVRGNRISGFPSAGIELDDVDDNAIVENTVSGCGIGIDVHGNGNTIARNTVEGSDDDGILVSGRDNIIDRNRSQGNAAFGIEVRDGPAGGTGNIITGNTASFNFADGISASSIDDSTIDQNRGQANGFGGLSVEGNNNTIARNVFDQNAENGISVLGDGSTIDQNRGRLNGFNGLTVGGGGNTVSRNAFNDNGEVGICVSSGNTDGGGNRASGNGVEDISFGC